MDDFATMAFSFVLGYAERALRNESKMVTVGPDGVRHKTDSTKRLEMVVRELHHLWDVWNGMEG